MNVEGYRRLVACAQACGGNDPDWRRCLAIARLGASAGVGDVSELTRDAAVDVEAAYQHLLTLAPTQEAINALMATRHLLELEAQAVH